MTETEMKDLELSQTLVKMKEENYNRMMIEQEKRDRKILLGSLGIMATILTAAGAIAVNHMKDKMENKIPSEPVKIEQNVSKNTLQKAQRVR